VKGFPNQAADLRRLTSALKVFADLLAAGENPRHDDVYGEELVRRGVLRTGHRPMPIGEYLEEQKRKPPSYRSYQTSARGLRELFRILGLIRDADEAVSLTARGTRIAALPDGPLGDTGLRVWGEAIRNFSHYGNQSRASHPYRVLIRLVAKKPGITRAKCALALEARDDSDEELRRIVGLADLPEDEIVRLIGETKTNWNNAKKILPKFAEQLGDVVKVRGRFYLAQAADEPGVPRLLPGGAPPAPGRRREPRVVTSDSIARAGTGDEEEDFRLPGEVGLDPTAVAAAIAARRDRVTRHNTMVRALAAALESTEAGLYEDPFDCLAVYDDRAVLAEVKTLDGTEADEREQVRRALAQLKYYEAFDTADIVGDRETAKVACFEAEISEEHKRWLLDNDILTIWKAEDGFEGDVSFLS